MNAQIAQNIMSDKLWRIIDNNNETIQNQAKVIKENWSELQTLKRILIDEHPATWREIKNKIQ